MEFEVHGHCKPGFQAIRDAFVSNFENGYDLGASLAITHGDEFVVDLWGGWLNEKRTRPWQQDTLVMVASSTKIATNLCALMLVDQGRLDPEAPVIRYWPEFDRHGNGKDKVLVKHIFAHTSGLPGFDPPIPNTDMCEWDRVIAHLENQTLWHEPGAQICYHASTFGHLAGELIRRISGQTPGTILREQIASKVDLEFWLGTPKSEFSKCTPPILEDTPGRGFAGRLNDRLMNSLKPPAPMGADAIMHESPGSNGMSNGRGLATIGAIHANGGTFQGHRFLREETLEFALEEQSWGLDEFAGQRIRRGFGLGINSAEWPCPSDRTLHWGGRGGSFCSMDLASRLAIAYVPNDWRLSGFSDDPRHEALDPAFQKIARAMAE